MPSVAFDLPLGRADATASGQQRDTRTISRILRAVTAPLVAIYLAVARHLLPYDMSDQPRAIFDAMVAHPEFERVGAWPGTLLAPTCIAGGCGCLAEPWRTGVAECGAAAGRTSASSACSSATRLGS
jgi:hypothetical protein